MRNLPKNEESKRKLIDAAGQIFAEVGYKAATIRQITDRAEANVAAVNYYFGDKLQLYRTVLQTVTEQLVRMLSANCSEGSPEERLRQFVRSILVVRSQEEDSWASLLMVREITELQGEQVEFIVEAVRPLHLIAVRIVAGLAAGGDQGRIELAASLLVTMCINRVCQQRLERRLSANHSIASDGLEGTVEHVSRFALAGIQAMCRVEP
jgi:AcrR family transcriptional regulator